MIGRANPRIYPHHPDGPMPSITTLLDLIHKPWMGSARAAAALAPVKALLDSPGRLRRKLKVAVKEGAEYPASWIFAKQVGSAVHHLIRAWATGRLDREYLRWMLSSGYANPWTGEVAPIEFCNLVYCCWLNWLDWATSVNLTPLLIEGKPAVEIKAYGPGYGCRIDMVAYVNGVLTLIDWKVSKSWDHDMYALQTAAQWAAFEATYPELAGECFRPTRDGYGRDTEGLTYDFDYGVCRCLKDGSKKWKYRRYTDTYDKSMEAVYALANLWKAVRG